MSVVISPKNNLTQTDEGTHKDAEQLRAESKLVIAMKNADAIAQTLVKHGELISALHQEVSDLRTQVTNLSAEVQMNKSQIHRALVQTYGTGPTA